MTSTDRTQLEHEKSAIERELKRRDKITDTEAQLVAARGHNGRPQKPEYKPQAEWSATERQAFAARGVKPLRRHEGDDD